MISKYVCSAAIACLLLSAPAQAAVSPQPLAILSGNGSFGYSVATDGQRVLIGTGENTAFLFDPYTKQQLAAIAVPAGGFGTSLALQGNSAVVGTGNGAYLFNFTSASPSPLKLTPIDNPSARIGFSVDLSGDVIIAGANGDATFGNSSGAAYLFDRTTGAQFAKLTAHDSQPMDNFGISVSVDDGLAAVGSTRQFFDGGGALYLFNAEKGFVGNRQLGAYSNPSPSSFYQFGYNSDLNGQTLVATEAFGQSFVWQVGGTPTPLPFSQFNTRAVADGISVSEEYIALGFDKQGYVNLYDKSGRLLRNLTPAPGIPSIGFGTAVAIEGDLLVVSGGSPGAARAYVYRVQDILIPEPSALLGMLFGFAAVTALRRRLTLHAAPPVRDTP